MYSAVRSPGRMPGMKPPWFFQIFRGFRRIEDDRRIEEREEDDESDIEDQEQRPP